MNRKKTNLVIKTLVSAIAIPSAINFLISRNAKNKSLKPETKYYNWKYGKVSYCVKGEGNPLLLIHSIGNGHNSFEWNKNVDVLSKYYEVYTLDLIGFGNSDKPNMDYTAYLYSQLILDFITDVIKSPANIIANSMSAAFTVMAYSLSDKYFKKMLLIAPCGIGDTNTSSEKKDSIKKLFISLPLIGTSFFNYISSKKNIKKYLKENVFFDESYITDDILDKYYCAAHSPNFKYPMSSFLNNYMNINIENAVSKVDIPLYIVWGKNSEISPLSNLERIKELNPNIEYAIFDQTKLLPNMENAREFNNICMDFFEA